MANWRLEFSLAMSLGFCLSACGPSSGGQSGTDAGDSLACPPPESIEDLNRPISNYGVSANQLYSIIEREWWLWNGNPDCAAMSISLKRGNAGTFSEVLVNGSALACGPIRLDAEVTVEVLQYELIAHGTSVTVELQPPETPSESPLSSTAAVGALGTARFAGERQPTVVKVEFAIPFKLFDPSYEVGFSARVASVFDSVPWSVYFGSHHSCSSE